MSRFALRLIEKIDETHDTKTFRFALNGHNLDFLPGHFIMANKMIVGKLVRRAYSISSSPLNKKSIDLTIKRVENGIFSNYMYDNANVGDSIDMDGPYGKFIYNDGSNGVVLISAGCWIAPLMSMARYIIEKGINVNVIMLHSCKTPNDVLFREEMLRIQENNENFKYIVTITRPTGFDWNGKTGRINEELLRSIIKGGERFFVSGRVEFGHSIVSMLRNLGVKDENI